MIETTYNAVKQIHILYIHILLYNISRYLCLTFFCSFEFFFVSVMLGNSNSFRWAVYKLTACLAVSPSSDEWSILYTGQLWTDFSRLTAQGVRTCIWTFQLYGLRRTDIGCEQFERFLKTYRFVWALRSRLIVTICLNCASQNFLTYSHTYTYLL